MLGVTGFLPEISSGKEEQPGEMWRPPQHTHEGS